MRPARANACESARRASTNENRVSVQLTAASSIGRNAGVGADAREHRSERRARRRPAIRERRCRVGGTAHSQPAQPVATQRGSSSRRIMHRLESAGEVGQVHPRAHRRLQGPSRPAAGQSRYDGAVPADAGIRFGQYVLLRRIARGGMAEVFLAQQRGLEGFDRRVAVKRILPHLADSPDFVKMFLGEAKLAAQLSHPNIVHIYEFGKVENDYFIAMEFVDGVHAGQLFKHGEQEKLPPTLVARIGADAANALHYAHELRGAERQALRPRAPRRLAGEHHGVVRRRREAVRLRHREGRGAPAIS